MARYNTVLNTTSSSGTATVSNPIQGQFTTLTGAAPYTVTLATPSSCQGQSQGFWNNTGGVVTLTTPSGNIYGPGNNTQTSYIMYNNSVVNLASDGTNYIVTGTVSQNMVQYNINSTQAVNSANAMLWVNTATVPVTVTLSATPQQGDTLRIVDIANTFSTNNLTINPNGQPIMGSVASMTVATQGAAFDMIYSGVTNGWKIFTI